ncbi:hypothetical protein GETHOR_15790 [Geothrix oryzae]|uniref:SRPBCC family protein n=1 Tax=Geothrix oryzae TaxID=2927975 RepID=A0ABM8DR61_9BACT|nr:hypothetical protein [Geothrix oryzae]BDU69478.1 hypothetical protein GETHOR_15790 [Geothrix oryzae]
MKHPVFSFEAELLTDAPFDHIVERLRAAPPQLFKSLRPLSRWAAPEVVADGVILRWTRTMAGAEESGELTLRPDPKGAHLRLEGRMKGWAGFLFFGLLRWRTDRLLDRFVEEL